MVDEEGGLRGAWWGGGESFPRCTSPSIDSCSLCSNKQQKFQPQAQENDFDYSLQALRVIGGGDVSHILEFSV